MQNNKIIKLIIIMLIIFITLLNLNIIVYATGPEDDPDAYNPIKSGVQEPELQEKAGYILGAINVIGVIVSVITLMIAGIKYMIGSVEEKAEYKKAMITYLIGAILVFSVTTIPNILYQIGTSMNNSQQTQADPGDGSLRY